MHKGKLIRENSVVEMTEKEAEEFSDFLEPFSDKGKTSKPITIDIGKSKSKKRKSK